ncbi:hypothetical protein BC828DRAFT_386478 [Blastocladiella britannica]|nr:hypothetical protein BC828DRAFT_386478 [Blastocladiella britannica]
MTSLSMRRHRLRPMASTSARSAATGSVDAATAACTISRTASTSATHAARPLPALCGRVASTANTSPASSSTSTSWARRRIGPSATTRATHSTSSRAARTSAPGVWQWAVSDRATPISSVCIPGLPRRHADNAPRVSNTPRTNRCRCPLLVGTSRSACRNKISHHRQSGLSMSTCSSPATTRSNSRLSANEGDADVAAVAAAVVLASSHCSANVRWLSGIMAASSLSRTRIDCTKSPIRFDCATRKQCAGGPSVAAWLARNPRTASAVRRIVPVTSVTSSARDAGVGCCRKSRHACHCSSRLVVSRSRTFWQWQRADFTSGRCCLMFL